MDIVIIVHKIIYAMGRGDPSWFFKFSNQSRWVAPTVKWKHMKEFIYSRNAVYETLRAKRRDVFRIELAEGVQVKSRLTEILALAAALSFLFLRGAAVGLGSAPRILPSCLSKVAILSRIATARLSCLTDS